MLFCLLFHLHMFKAIVLLLKHSRGKNAYVDTRDLLSFLHSHFLLCLISVIHGNCLLCGFICILGFSAAAHLN